VVLSCLFKQVVFIYISWGSVPYSVFTRCTDGLNTSKLTSTAIAMAELSAVYLRSAVSVYNRRSCQLGEIKAAVFKSPSVLEPSFRTLRCAASKA